LLPRFIDSNPVARSAVKKKLPDMFITNVVVKCRYITKESINRSLCCGHSRSILRFELSSHVLLLLENVALGVRHLPLAYQG
jgi:hypothetical protein